MAAFFANSTNFQITGGSFNVIHGDMVKTEHTHATYISNSHNNYADDNYPEDNYSDYYYPDDNYPAHVPNQYYGGQHAPWPPRGRHRPHPRSQRRHQEHGGYGYAEYYDDRESEGYRNGGYGPSQDVPSRFEDSLRSPERHIEIAGGEFISTHGRARRLYRSSDVAESFAREWQDSIPDSTPVSSESELLPETDLNAQENPSLDDSSSDIPMSDESTFLQNGTTPASTSISAETPPPISGHRAPTNLEMMRRGDGSHGD
ncbi:hypothetical protein MSAN_01666100 [Mycena sanguinolenta]|uniref:Uncharacterized protein n=1 Tax=Mycena sanguinolenta TaxID=230812 RepID=A0A8H6Y0J9_9AGAR|nr:hypothetical protein MSAN_01666100 [Mycena sanguinolenta]